MNTAAGESYQDRVRYYRRQAEQARANKNRWNWSKNEQNREDVNVDFDEAIYNFKNSNGFDKVYNKAKRQAKKHAYDQLSFYRDDEQGYIGGVCAGIADKMSWDVTKVRVGVAITGLIFTLPTIIAYVAATVFLRKKNLAFYGRDEHSFWKSASQKSGKQDAGFDVEESS